MISIKSPKCELNGLFNGLVNPRYLFSSPSFVGPVPQSKWRTEETKQNIESSEKRQKSQILKSESFRINSEMGIPNCVWLFNTTISRRSRHCLPNTNSHGTTTTGKQTWVNYILKVINYNYNYFPRNVINYSYNYIFPEFSITITQLHKNVIQLLFNYIFKALKSRILV